jgi:hypothetical protein
MHRRSIECAAYLRDDGLWEAEVRLLDTKPYHQRATFRGEIEAGDPVHDIRLRLAVDDAFVVREAETQMRSTPFPTCIEVETVLQRLVGERIGAGWRELVRRKIPRLESCTHLTELLGPAVTTLFQTAAHGKSPEGHSVLEDQRHASDPPFFLNGCHSWRIDGPIVAALFPQFAIDPSTDT